MGGTSTICEELFSDYPTSTGGPGKCRVNTSPTGTLVDLEIEMDPTGFEPVALFSSVFI